MPEESQALGAALQAAKEYVDLVVTGPLEQLGGLLTDVVGNWRLKNQINLVLKTKRFCEDRGIQPEKVLPSVFVPLLEEAGNTDDETLSDMFARLLAGQLDPKKHGGAHPSFAKVLGQLSSLDARMLRMIDDKDRGNSEKKLNIVHEGFVAWDEDTVVQEAANRFQVKTSDSDLSLANLARMRLVDQESRPKLGFIGSFYDIFVTEFGFRLLSVCSEPGTYWRDKTDSGENGFFRRDQAKSIPAQEEIAELKRTVAELKSSDMFT
jgi:Abortive infection alpha